MSEKCTVCWGSHGCSLQYGHDGAHGCGLQYGHDGAHACNTFGCGDTISQDGVDKYGQVWHLYDPQWAPWPDWTPEGDTSA